GDVANDVEFHRVDSLTYDPVTDTTTAAEVVTTVKGIFTRGKEDEDDGDSPDDISTKLIIAALDLGAVPDGEDYFMINGARWEIVKLVYDPTRAIYIFTIRVP